jgi:hypothetical protein
MTIKKLNKDFAFTQNRLLHYPHLSDFIRGKNRLSLYPLFQR